jgi:hypothetical protein
VVGRLGSDGFWKEDYGWGVRVRRHFGARGSSVRYGTRLGDLKESWFILFPIKHSTHTHTYSIERKLAKNAVPSASPLDKPEGRQ